MVVLKKGLSKSERIWMNLPFASKNGNKVNKAWIRKYGKHS